MKRLLAVLARLPYPLIDGYKLREYHLLRNVTENWNITPLVFFEPGVSPADVEQFRKWFPSLIESPNESLVFSPKKRAVDRLRRLLLPTDGFPPRMRALIDREISSGKYDLVYVAGRTLLPYFADYLHVPIVVDLGDDQTILTYQAFRLEKNFWQKLKLFKGWCEGRLYLRKYVRSFRYIVLTSQVDAESIKRISGRSHVHVLPNGVDSEYFGPSSRFPEEGSPTLCFTGVMSYEPNDDAMRYFYKAIFPLIKEQCPDLRLFIVGKDPSTKLIETVKDDTAVTVTGYVSDIRRYLGAAIIYVAPLRMGSGIKNKILEAWAMGKAVVSTNLGCAGIDVVPGRNIIIADRSDTFAAEVITLLRDRHKRERLGQNGRKWVEQRYSWKDRGLQLSALLSDAVGS